MSGNSKVLDILKSLFFILYFVILTAERLISLITMATSTGFFHNPFNAYMEILTVFAIIGGWSYLFVKGRVIFKPSAPKQGSDFLHPSIAAGILLLGGMVHTVGTIAPIQFGSYGCLLAAMGIFTFESAKEEGKPLLKWLSFAYITAFSMAIPVVYEQIHDCGLCNAYNIIQIFVSVLMVMIFTGMLFNFFSHKAELKFMPYPIILAVIGDALVLGLQWHAKINDFVLIFIIVAAFLYVVGKTAYCITYHKKTN